MPQPLIGITAYHIHNRADDPVIALDEAYSRIPFLGICRGIQVINVALGGTLYADIAGQFSEEIRHDCYPDLDRDQPAHDVAIAPGSRLAQVLGMTRVATNSMHHQAVRQLAPGLVATAYAPDGLLEAFEIPEHAFGLAVQWHPECMPDSPPMQLLFRAFAEAAGRAPGGG
jgi:putative glutamine amidotransferase